MKNFSIIAVILFAVSVSAPVLADEVGPGKPKSNNTTTTQSMSTASDCSWIETWFGTCTSTEETSTSE